METDKYAPTRWGQAIVPEDECRLPSGQLVRVQRLGVGSLVAQGVFGSLDEVSAMLDPFTITVDGKRIADPNLDAAKVFANLDSMLGMLDAIDRVTRHVVIEPKVERPPADYSDRVPGVVYSDAIPTNDKLFLLHYALSDPTKR